MWTRSARVLAAALLASLALSGCGGDDTATDPVGEDPAGGSTSDSPSASPTDAPTVGSYPEFGPDDYEYTLQVSCFCPDAGVPVRVTVTDGDVSEAVYARSGRGFDKGSAAPDHRAVTINDVIAAANTTDAESVQVDWPDGQDYPNDVFVDQSSRIADEEIGYTISDVDVG